MMCSVCNKNIAVVFITKIMDGKQSQQGLCLLCAKKQGLDPINQMLEQTRISDDEINDLSNQMKNLFENINDIPSIESDIEDRSTINKENPFLNFINSSFMSKDIETELSKNHNANILEEKDGKGCTKTRTQQEKSKKKRKYLDAYGINFTILAEKGMNSLAIGRDKEIARIIQILNRKTKNNPVLIGEAGVGKTTIVEELATRICNKQVPAKLLGTEIIGIDMAGIVAGTQFRGQFESRMKGIIDEAKSIGNIILVIDELHNIMGAGEAEGALNAANILKPILSKGEIQIIGITTINEYRKYIEKDSAVERRFQPVLIEEPNVEETIEILRGIKSNFEEYHKVKISDEVIKAAAVLSKRYILDRNFPDKAIDIIDEAGSTANLKNVGLVDLKSLKDELRKVQEEKESAISADSIEDYQKAADLKIRECKLIQNIKDIEETCENIEITVNDLASVIEQWTKIPVKRITEEEASKLLNLENKIHSSIVGQVEAVKIVSRAIRRNRADFRKKRKPTSFVFVGPTGVGKTELVKAVAREIFGSEDALIRFDMSEFMEKHTASKLVGAPPGYVGYDDRGQLTEKVRRKPYSVILLDEIEKAHPDVFNILLQVLDDGRLTDSHGKTVSFENTVLIMTSNAGTNTKSNGIGFSASENYALLENKVNNVLKDTFKPEFLNRLDEIVIFKELSKEELMRITRLMLDEVIVDANSKDIQISISDAAVEFLLSKGYDPKYGARPLRRAIQRYIEDELTDGFLLGKYHDGSDIFIDCQDDALCFKNS